LYIGTVDRFGARLALHELVKEEVRALFEREEVAIAEDDLVKPEEVLQGALAELEVLRIALLEREKVTQ
jgi:hypothetical protein